MTVAEILGAFGDLADDLVTPPLWSDAVRLRFLREAQLEAGRRARLFQDQSTDEIRLLMEMLVRAYDPCVSCSTHFLNVTFV